MFVIAYSKVEVDGGTIVRVRFKGRKHGHTVSPNTVESWLVCTVGLSGSDCTSSDLLPFYVHQARASLTNVSVVEESERERSERKE